MAPKSIDELRSERKNLGGKSTHKPAKRKKGLSIDELRAERGYDEKQRARPAKHGTSVAEVREARASVASKRRPPVVGKKDAAKAARAAAAEEKAAKKAASKKAPPASED